MSLRKQKGFIVFTDLKGFSTLNDAEQHRYVNIHLDVLGKTIKPFLQDALVYNTWGDAIVAVFEDGLKAAEFMLLYRKETKRLLQTVAKDKRFLARIAGHFGEVKVFKDPLLDTYNVLSSEVNTAARIEPITRAGEIFVSVEFKEAYIQQVTGEHAVKFERLGMIPLAKGYGEWELYRLIHQTEKAHIIDKLFELELDNAIPEVSSLTEREKTILEQLKVSSDQRYIQSTLQGELENVHTGAFAVELAFICKRVGLYETGIEWINRAQEETYAIDDKIALAPYKTTKKIIKLKADLLTRLDRYEESADILYRLWKNIEDNEKTEDASEILAMLAAQFKRRALMDENELLPREKIDQALLEKAASLYLEAFRYDTDDFYPAINAAYLLVLLGGDAVQTGKELAQYILDTWLFLKHSSQWLDFTLAEAELILENYPRFYEEMQEALTFHEQTVSIFDLEATKLQVYQFLQLSDQLEKGKVILDLLEKAIEQKRTGKRFSF